MPVRTAWRMHSRLGTGSMPGIAASTRLTWRVGLGAERGRGAGEQLGLAGDLGVDLEADHDLPVAGGALDAIGGLAHADRRYSRGIRGSSAHSSRPRRTVYATHRDPPCRRRSAAPPRTRQRHRRDGLGEPAADAQWLRSREVLLIKRPAPAPTSGVPQTARHPLGDVRRDLRDRLSSPTATSPIRPSRRSTEDHDHCRFPPRYEELRRRS